MTHTVRGRSCPAGVASKKIPYIPWDIAPPTFHIRPASILACFAVYADVGNAGIADFETKRRKMHVSSFVEHLTGTCQRALEPRGGTKV